MGSMTPRYVNDDKVEEPRRGLGLRFWNFMHRATIGPNHEATVGRHTGARI
jgi:hypothetical protein